MEELTQTFIYLNQSMFWMLFMIIDANLLVPTVLLRYIARIKSKSEVGPRDRKTVVVVGGSFAGLAAVRELQNNALFRVILIDQNEYFEYTPGILRLFCEPDAMQKLAHPMPKGSHQVIKGTVTRTWNSHVTYVDAETKKPQTIAFDYLILATGSTYNHPITASALETTLKARQFGWKASARRLKEASSALILGAGPVGVELAAEIVDHFKEGRSRKSVTLVDMATTLVPVFPKGTADYAEQWLKDHGVNLVLGQLLESWDDHGCTLKNGKIIRADIVYVCFGDKPNSDPLVSETDNKKGAGNSGTMSPVRLDRRKCIQVDEFMRVEGRRNVFCCGDVSAPPTDGIKQAFHAEVQGHLAANNVIRLATGRPFERYPQDAALGSDSIPLVYVLSLGKCNGVIGLNGLCIPGPLAPIVKWIIEWTKVRQMLGRPVGILIWKIGEPLAMFLGKFISLPTKHA